MLRRGCCSRRGTSRVAGSRNVNGAGRALADDPELPVVEPREAADLRQVAAHQRQVMALVDARGSRGSVAPPRVAEAAAERVATNRSDRRSPPPSRSASAAQADQPRLRMRGVDGRSTGPFRVERVIAAVRLYNSAQILLIWL